MVFDLFCIVILFLAALTLPGHGVYRYENTFYRYEGQWKEGFKHGMLYR